MSSASPPLLSRLFLLLLLLLALFAGWSVWYATPAGLGLTNDSAAYLGGARSILAGTGYSDIWLDSTLEAITHYPPLLSLTLSLLSRLSGLDPYRTARVLHILLFSANTVLMGWLGWRLSASQTWGRLGIALFPAFLFATNADLLRIHAQVLSEPLFLFFSLLAFLTFDVALQRSPNPAFGSPLTAPASPINAHRSLITDYGLWTTGFLTGLAFLTRYSGLALIATFLIAIFLLSPTLRRKQTLLFLAGVIPPVAGWLLRNALVADSVTNRTVHFNPIELSNIRTGLWNVAHFLSPLPGLAEWLFGSGLLQILLILFGVGLLGWLSHRAWMARQDTSALAFTTALYVFGYLGAVLFSMSFFDASTKFQPRILAPLYVSWMLLLTAGLSALIGQNHLRLALAGALTLMAVVFSGFGISREITSLRAMDGLGYASWRWRQAEVMAYLRRLPPEIAIYTNSPPAVYHVTGRASRVIPSTLDPVSGLPRRDYEQTLAEMRAELLAGRAVLALFEVSSLEEAFGEQVALQFKGLPLLLKAQGHVLYGNVEINK